MSKEQVAVAEIEDFSSTDLDASETSRMTVLIGGKPSSWVWVFAGPGHPKTVEQNNRLSRERLHRQALMEQAQVNGKKWKAEEETVDEARLRNVDWIVGRLVDWTPVKIDGELYAFSAENARKLLLDPKKASLFTQGVSGGRAVFYQALRSDLIAHAERVFALGVEDKDGHTLRETLEGLLKRARTPERRAEIEDQLAVPEMPVALAYLWSAFQRIRSRRGGNGFGPSPITWADIDAYVRLSGVRLAPWEVEIVEALDDVWLREMATRDSTRGQPAAE